MATCDQLDSWTRKPDRFLSRTATRNVLCLFIFLTAAVCIPSSPATAQWLKQSSNVVVDLRSVSFVDAMNGYVVGDDGIALRTTDGGATWGPVGIMTKKAIGAVGAYRAPAGQIVAVFVGTDGFCMISTDGGETCTPSPSTIDDGISLKSVQIVNDSTFYLTGQEGTLGGIVFRTTDRGMTWTKLRDRNLAGFTESYFLDPQHGFAVGGTSDDLGAIERTDDGGANWTTAQHSTMPVESIAALDEHHIVAVGLGGDLYSTVDGGSQWLAPALPTPADLYSVQFRDAKNGAIAGTGTVLVTNDGGVTWQSASYPADDILYAAQVLQDGSVIAVGSNGTIMKNETNAIVPTKSGNGAARSMVSVWPNPAHEYVSVATPGAAELTLYNALGEQVLRAGLFAHASGASVSDASSTGASAVSGIANSVERIRCTALPRGIYRYLVTSRDGSALGTGNLVLL